jgi:lysophospholipase
VSGWQTSTARTRDGVTIRVGVRPALDPRGHVLLLQGRGDFLDKYGDTAARVADLGLSVLSWDWRGQGDSESTGAPRGALHVDRFGDYLLDLDAAVGTAPDLPGPRVLIGHSMGGLVALLHLLRSPGDAAAAVLLSPMLAFRGTPPAPVVAALARGATALGRGRAWAAGEAWTPADACTLTGNMATGDPDGFTRLQALRLARSTGLVTGSTWGWTAAAVAAMRAVARADLGAVRADVLVASAPADPTVDPAAHRALVRRLPRARLVEYPGRHDLLFESPATTGPLWADLAAHLDRALGRPRATAGPA